MQYNMDWELNTSLCTAASFPQTNEGGAVNDLRKSVWIKKNIQDIYNCTAKTIPTANNLFVP